MHYFKVLTGSLVAVVFLLTNSLISVIISVDKLIGPNGKKVYILGDYHVPKESVDQQQRQDLVQFLEKNSTQENTSVYVEDITTNYSSSKHEKTFLNYLMRDIQKTTNDQMQIYSLEKSPVSTAFFSMVSYTQCVNMTCPSKTFAYNQSLTGPAINWTIKQLEEEYSAYAREVKNLCETILPKQAIEPLQNACAKSDHYFSYLLKDLYGNLNCKPDDRLSLIAFKGYHDYVQNIRQQRNNITDTTKVLELYNKLLHTNDIHEMISLWKKLCYESGPYMLDILSVGKSENFIPKEYKILRFLLIKSMRNLVTYYAIAKILSPRATQTTVICTGAAHALDIVEFLKTHAQYTHTIHASMYLDTFNITNIEHSIIPITLSDYLI